MSVFNTYSGKQFEDEATKILKNSPELEGYTFLSDTQNTDKNLRKEFDLIANRDENSLCFEFKLLKGRRISSIIPMLLGQFLHENFTEVLLAVLKDEATLEDEELLNTNGIGLVVIDIALEKANFILRGRALEKNEASNNILITAAKSIEESKIENENLLVQAKDASLKTEKLLEQLQEVKKDFSQSIWGDFIIGGIMVSGIFMLLDTTLNLYPLTYVGLILGPILIVLSILAWLLRIERIKLKISKIKKPIAIQRGKGFRSRSEEHISSP
jgi:hypothetical protein